jgi:hypothetical protein
LAAAANAVLFYEKTCVIIKAIWKGGNKLKNRFERLPDERRVPPVIDGVSNAVLNYAEIINAKIRQGCGCDTEIPGSERQLCLSRDTYPSIGINSKPLKSYRAGYPFDPAALRRLESMRFDIIHSHCPWFQR